MSSQQTSLFLPPEYAAMNSAPAILSEINNRYNKAQLKSLCQQSNLDDGGFKHALLGRYSLHLMRLPITDANEELAMGLWRANVVHLVQIVARGAIDGHFCGKAGLVCGILEHTLR